MKKHEHHVIDFSAKFSAQYFNELNRKGRTNVVKIEKSLQ